MASRNYLKFGEFNDALKFHASSLHLLSMVPGQLVCLGSVVTLQLRL